MKATVEQLQEAIARERAYQVAKWGDRQLTLAGWLLVAESELDEAIEAWVRGKWDKEAKAELLQFVTVGHRWLEMEERPLDFSYCAGVVQQRPLEEWLICAKSLVHAARKRFPYNDFSGVAAMLLLAIEDGVMGLLQHGIVERGEL
jgi:hypothetical protein